MIAFAICVHTSNLIMDNTPGTVAPLARQHRCAFYHLPLATHLALITATRHVSRTMLGAAWRWLYPAKLTASASMPNLARRTRRVPHARHLFNTLIEIGKLSPNAEDGEWAAHGPDVSWPVLWPVTTQAMCSIDISLTTGWLSLSHVSQMFILLKFYYFYDSNSKIFLSEKLYIYFLEPFAVLQIYSARLVKHFRYSLKGNFFCV